MDPLHNWQKVNVKGDGTCGYHAIMYALSQNSKYNALVEEIKTFNSPSVPKNIINHDLYLGFKLRNYISNRINTIKEIIEKSNNSLTANILGQLNNLYNLRELLQKTIITTGVVQTTKNLKQNTLFNKYNIILLLQELIKKIDTNEWIDDEMLNIVAKFLEINIFIYRNKDKKWYKIIGVKNNIKKSENAIFIFYDGSHYQTLLPKIDYKLKNNFTNLSLNSETSAGQLFEYDFLKIKHKPYNFNKNKYYNILYNSQIQDKFNNTNTAILKVQEIMKLAKINQKNINRWTEQKRKNNASKKKGP